MVLYTEKELVFGIVTERIMYHISRYSWTSAVNWLPGGRFGCFLVLSARAVLSRHLKLCVNAFGPKFGLI